MKLLPKLLAAAGLCAMFGCESKLPEIHEELTGPYTTVCVESYRTYNYTMEIIDSLKNELKPLGIETENDFCIVYERTKNAEKSHSIVGCIIKQDNPEDSSAIIKLIRNNFMVRTIGETKSMVFTVPYEEFDSPLRQKMLNHIDQYIKENNYLQIPNGVNGIMEIYHDNKITFVAEIRPSR
ncbi:MAG: hypothetical protein IKQ70_10480 [Bacteroidales bacterium]|nr:hypothetical protein [Bacteroidales bacterium]